MQCYQIISALERVKGHVAAFQCRKLVLTGTTPRSGIKVTDIGVCATLEMTGGHHTITTIVPSATEHQYPFRVEGTRHIGKCLTCALHQLEVGHPE
jgi:hypothetical protein